MHQPANALEAVTHTDPYPFYERLRREHPLYWDPELKMWVAASAAAVEAALLHPALRVRPSQEPVPVALQGTAAATLFASLVRMNDGAFHAAHKPQVGALAASLPLQQLSGLAARLALELQDRVDPNELLTRLPVLVMATALGVAAVQRDAMARQVQAFTRGIVAGADVAQVAQAGEAAASLMALWQAQSYSEVQGAYRIGLMMQSLDAGAGLLGNTAALLQQEPALGEGLAASHFAASELVAEVARWDAPIQNTRRFAASALTLLGQQIAAGQGVLLVLASANRDETLNADPEAFDSARLQRRSVGFGLGAHACPAERIAIETIAAGARAIWAGGQFNSYFRASGEYVALPNARIPVFLA